jgi:hypothetical protein
MIDLWKIRFITANYSVLHGLKLVPIGLFLFYAFVFDNAQIGRATRDLTIPCLLTPVIFVLYLLIHLYYQKTFGRVEQTARSRSIETVIFLGFASIAWVAFAVDTLRWIPVSFFALYLALMLLLGQLGMVRHAGGKNPAVFPAGLVCITLIFLSAFLPLLGGEFSENFGFHSGIALVGAVVGILYALYGVLEHLFLVRLLAPAGKVAQKQSD